MSVLIEPIAARPRAASSTVDVAGIAWPTHKLHAVIAAFVVAVATLVLTTSGQAAMWLSLAVLVSVWWGERFWQARRPTSGRS